MNRRWLLFDFIDPAFGLSRPERKKILVSAMASKGTQKHITIGLIAGNLLSLAACALLNLALSWLIPSLGLDAFLFSIVLFFPLSIYFVSLYCYYRAIVKPLRMAMHRHGYEYCHQCSQPLTGMGKVIEQCPECGSSREPLICQSCGYDLTGLEGDPPPCPECGDTQKTFRNPSRWWWLRFQQVDHRFLYFPESARRRIVQVAWNEALGRFLIAMLLIVVSGVALALFFIPLAHEESALPLALEFFLALLFYPAIFCFWCFIAASFHKTYGVNCRRQYRELGYDLCHKCGRMLDDLDEGALACPDCNAPRLAVTKVASREAGLPTQEEFKTTNDSHHALIWVHASNRMRILIYLVLSLGMIYGVSGLVAQYANNTIGWTLYGFAILSMLVGSVVNHRKTLRRLVRQDLHKKGHDLCTACGFWFTQLDETPDRCPECGRKREKMPISTLEEDVA